MTYFTTFATIDELKAQYKTLAKKFHPDVVGGDAETFKAVANEYQNLLVLAMKGQFKTDAEIDEALNLDKVLRETLDKIITIEAVDIEITGTWIWVSGTGTYNGKEQLKAAGFRWSKKRKSWYFREEKKDANGEVIKKRYRSSGIEMSEIRAKYGSKK